MGPTCEEGKTRFIIKKTKSTKTNKQKHVNISVRDVLLKNPRFNTEGSYMCTCKPGCHGDGLTCEGKTLKVWVI